MYVQRVGGVIVGAFSNPQPGYATEFVPDVPAITVTHSIQMPDQNTLMGFLSTNSSAQNKAILLGSIPSVGQPGRLVVISDGVYLVDPGITITNKQCNNEIRGNASCFAYEAIPVTAPLILKFTTGTTAFDLSAFSPLVASAGTYTKFANMSLDGQNLCGIGINSNGQTLFEWMNVSNFNTGIWLNSWTNMASLYHVSANGNNYGFFVGPGAATLFDNTLFNVSNFTFRQNTVGMRIEQADGYSIRDGVIESNAATGAEFFRWSTGNGHSANRGGTLEHVWFENNGAASNDKPQVNIDASIRSMNKIDAPNNITFRKGGLICYPTDAKYPNYAPGVWKPLLNIDCAHDITFDGTTLSTIDPANDGPGKAIIKLGVTTSNIKFKGCPGNFTVIDANNGTTGSAVIP